MLIDKEQFMPRLREVILYGVFYMISFMLLEKREVAVSIIHTAMDDQIPFISAFIIPYFLWFAYVGISCVYFVFFVDSYEEYYRFSRSLAAGCTVFLVISYFFPNGQDLRPAVLGNGFFDQLVARLYCADTSTNVFPSIHVFNSIICGMALYGNKRFREHKLLVVSNAVLAISIVLATMFLKQHTVLDVTGGLILAAFCIEYYYGVVEHVRVPESQYRVRQRLG